MEELIFWILVGGLSFCLVLLFWASQGSFFNKNWGTEKLYIVLVNGAEKIEGYFWKLKWHPVWGKKPVELIVVLKEDQQEELALLSLLEKRGFVFKILLLKEGESFLKKDGRVIWL